MCAIYSAAIRVKPDWLSVLKWLNKLSCENTAMCLYSLYKTSGSCSQNHRKQFPMVWYHVIETCILLRFQNTLFPRCKCSVLPVPSRCGVLRRTFQRISLHQWRLEQTGASRDQPGVNDQQINIVLIWYMLQDGQASVFVSFFYARDTS